MSRALEVADLDAAKSNITLKVLGGQYILEGTDISVLYRNFSGREINGYNQDHIRSFNMVLTPEQLIELKDIQDQIGLNFNIRTKNIFSDEDVARGQKQRQIHYVNVKIRFVDNEEMASRNPLITLYTPVRNKKGDYNATLLNKESMLDILDSTEIERWDAQLRIYSSGNKFRKAKEGAAFCTLYLYKLKAKASYEEEFGGYWDDFDEKNRDGSEIMTASEVVESTMACNPATGE